MTLRWTPTQGWHETEQAFKPHIVRDEETGRARIAVALQGAAPMKKVKVGEKEVSFAALCILMIDDVREKLHSDLAPCDEQAFADAYFEKDPVLKETILRGRY